MVAILYFFYDLIWHFFKEMIVHTVIKFSFYFLDCAHGLFVSTTHRVCHRLISSWKSDLNVSLAALELLSGLARIHMKESGGSWVVGESGRRNRIRKTF